MSEVAQLVEHERKTDHVRDPNSNLSFHAKDVVGGSSPSLTLYGDVVQTSFLYPSHPWTAEEDALVIKHEITDSELSEKIGRSVGAIHNRRYELKKLAR